MRIGLFTDTYYPQINGVATSVLMLKNNLEQEGHEVFVFTTTDPNAKEERNVYRVPSIPFKSAKRIGTLYHPLLSKIITGLGLDLIHTHTEFPLGIFGRAMARELDIPLVHTYHTIYEDYTHYIVKLGMLDSIAKKAARRLSARFCNSADRVIVPTYKVKQLLESYNVHKEIAVIPTGIELGKYSSAKYSAQDIARVKRESGLSEKDRIILYIGRLSEEKNIKEIMVSLRHYLQNEKHVKFVLVGDGPEKETLMALADRLQIDSNTVFLGEKPWDQIGLYYQMGDVFVSASQSETQGITYIEALASGLPVIAKSDPCLDEVIIEGVNGYTFKNEEEFLFRLREVLGQDHIRQSMSEEAVASVEKFSVQYFAKAIERQYLGMLVTIDTLEKVS